jgi:hypothetical protein
LTVSAGSTSRHSTNHDQKYLKKCPSYWICTFFLVNIFSRILCNNYLHIIYIVITVLNNPDMIERMQESISRLYENIIPFWVEGVEYPWGLVYKVLSVYLFVYLSIYLSIYLSFIIYRCTYHLSIIIYPQNTKQLRIHFFVVNYTENSHNNKGFFLCLYSSLISFNTNCLNEFAVDINIQETFVYMYI